MTLAERLEVAQPAQRGLPCRLATILNSLSEDDAHALRAALAVPKRDPLRLSSARIAEELRLEGYDLHYKSVETHRKRACRCYKHDIGRTSDA